MIYHEMGRVILNEEISEGIYQTTFESPLISATTLPGQFINILPEHNWNYVMRRPMSIASQGNDKISIIYKAIGEGTRIMQNWKTGEIVDNIGPLGNYWTGYKDTFPILIGGGVGIAPIINLHHLLINKDIGHILIMGARNGNEHFLQHKPLEQIYMSTDDGSLGINGNVVDALDSIYFGQSLPNNCKIYSCGPPLMMEAVRLYSIKNKLVCELAMETIMACGMGICQGCTVERKVDKLVDHSYRNRFALACMDGPIFSADEIITCE